MRYLLIEDVQDVYGVELSDQKSLDAELCRIIVDEGTEEELKGIIKKGANPNAICKVYYEGYSVLSLFYRDGATLKDAERLKFMKILLDAGASADSKDAVGDTVIILEILSFLPTTNDEISANIAKMLLKYGADPNKEDANGNSSLIHAVALRKKPCIEVLLDNGASVNAVSSTGSTLLIIACNADYDIVVMLLEFMKKNHQEDSINKKVNGKTVLDIVTDAKLKKLLKSYGAVSSKK